MGDRAMAEIKTDDGSIYVYTHWGGNNLPEAAKKAVKMAQDRLTDQPYAARILVDQLTKEGRDKLTGFGLMLQPNAEDEYNNDLPSVILDLIEQRLEVTRGGKTESWNFQEVVNIS